ncbi:reverse transcriptase domain-containing protein [Tanacetum coccineum]
MAIHVKEPENDPWYADYANFLVSKDEPYLFKSCPNRIIRRCVFGKELQEILEHCHKGTVGGHYRADITARKIFESRFYWPTIFKDTARHVRECDACQRVTGNTKEWVSNLDDALWAFKIIYKSPIGSTSFGIVYRKACHLPIEIEHKAYWALKNINLDLDAAGRNVLAVKQVRRNEK